MEELFYPFPSTSGSRSFSSFIISLKSNNYSISYLGLLCVDLNPPSDRTPDTLLITFRFFGLYPFTVSFLSAALSLISFPRTRPPALCYSRPTLGSLIFEAHWPQPWNLTSQASRPPSALDRPPLQEPPNTCPFPWAWFYFLPNLRVQLWCFLIQWPATGLRKGRPPALCWSGTHEKLYSKSQSYWEFQAENHKKERTSCLCFLPCVFSLVYRYYSISTDIGYLFTFSVKQSCFQKYLMSYSYSSKKLV